MANSDPDRCHHHDHRPNGSGFVLCGYDPARELYSGPRLSSALRPGEPEFEEVREQIEKRNYWAPSRYTPSIVSR